VFIKKVKTGVQEWENKKYCAKACMNFSKIKYPRIQKTCVHCKKDIVSKLKGRPLFTQKFCSNECSSKINSVPNINVFNSKGEPAWNKGKGQGWVDEKGYKRESLGNKKIRNHRLQAELALGRSLKNTEVIHHIDENKQNNNPENLYLFRSGGAHIKWHRYISRHGYKGLLTSNLNLYKVDKGMVSTNF
jgi:hypothetical protein